MAVFVDPLANWGWKLRGHKVESCHLFSDQLDLAELHEMARRIGMRRSWFQDGSTPHYDLTPLRRRIAVAQGSGRGRAPASCGDLEGTAREKRRGKCPPSRKRNAFAFRNWSGRMPN